MELSLVIALLGFMSFRSTFILKLYHSLNIFSRQQIDDVFFHFFPESKLWQSMQIVLRQFAINVKQFAWNIRAYFLEKNEKNISNCHLLKFLPRMFSVKALRKIVADNILKFVYYFSEKTSLGMWIVYLAEKRPISKCQLHHIWLAFYGLNVLKVPVNMFIEILKD